MNIRCSKLKSLTGIHKTINSANIITHIEGSVLAELFFYDATIIREFDSQDTRKILKISNNIKSLTKIFESLYQQVESFCQEYAVSFYEDSMKLPSPDNLPPSPLPHAGYEAGHKQSPLTKFIAYFA